MEKQRAKNRPIKIGGRFGRLEVVSFAYTTASRQKCYLCRCDCGNQKVIQGSNLRHNKTHSCGCLFVEVQRARLTKHGMRHKPIYMSWLRMKQRCENANCDRYKDWGGRGIVVCAEWHDFQTFYEYVSQLPHFGEKGYTLDRINNDGNYEPGNVRWATAKEQNNNQRKKVRH